MPTIAKKEFSKHQPEQIYQLVNDIRSYKKFVPWCAESLILDGELDHWMIAKLVFDFHGIKHGFTTKNTLKPHSGITIELVDGPFEHLHGNWQFLPAEGGCNICLNLDYDFNQHWLSSVFEPAFAQISNLLVNTFKERADAVY